MGPQGSLIAIVVGVVVAFGVSLLFRPQKTEMRVGASTTLTCSASVASAWRHVGDWRMRWAALPEVEVVHEQKRVIGELEEELLERDEERRLLSWRFSKYPATWQAGEGLSGSLQVMDDKSVRYELWSTVSNEQHKQAAQSMLQAQTDSAAAKLVSYIEGHPFEATAYSVARVDSTVEAAWLVTGDWTMAWADLDGIEVENGSVRTIGDDIEETLFHRSEENHYYAWVFSRYPSGWGAGNGLSGSLRVFEQDGSIFVEYGMWTQSSDEVSVRKHAAFLQKQTDDVIPKLVRSIESIK